MKRTVNMGENEPEQKKFDLPSEKEHLFQVTDIITGDDELGHKLKLDENTVSVKCEVVGGDEAGRTLLNRCSLDQQSKGFFATRIFLKGIGEPHKGQGIEIDTDRWIGRQFYATIVHNGTYANISEFNFEKKIEQQYQPVSDKKDIQWDN